MPMFGIWNQMENGNTLWSCCELTGLPLVSNGVQMKKSLQLDLELD